MTKWWEPSFDPMEELILQRSKITQVENNQRALVNAQNDLGHAVKELIEQNNQLVSALHNHKREIEQLKRLITTKENK